MYSPSARMRSGSNHIAALCAREETSLSRRSQTRVRAGQARMTCWTDSGPVPHHGQIGLGFSSNQDEWAARYLFAARIWWILPATNFPSPIKGCGEREGGTRSTGGGVVGGSVLDEHVPTAGPEGLVGPPHEVRRRNVRSGWGGGRVTQGEGM